MPPSPLTLLFWNIGGQRRTELLVGLARLHGIDILVLAECAVAPAEILAALGAVDPYFTYPTSECEAIQVYTRFPGVSLTPVLESARISIRRLHLPERLEILLAMMHLPSKRNRKESGQLLAATQ